MKKSKNPIDEVLLMKLFKEYSEVKKALNSNIKNEGNVSLVKKIVLKKLMRRSVSIRNEIIEMNIPLVEFVVIKYLSDIGVDIKELVSIGNFGLINAVETYDMDYGTKFSAYAVECIKNYIKKNLYTVTDINRKSFNYPILNAIYRIEKYNNIKLEDHLDELDDILSECPFIDESIKEKVKKYLRSKSIEYSEENISDTYEIVDTSIDNVLIEEMQKELDNLPYNEREVLKHRYGYYGYSHTLDDLGNYMSCTHQNISRTERKALSKLRKKMNCRF